MTDECMIDKFMNGNNSRINAWELYYSLQPSPSFHRLEAITPASVQPVTTPAVIDHLLWIIRNVFSPCNSCSISPPESLPRLMHTTEWAAILQWTLVNTQWQKLFSVVHAGIYDQNIYITMNPGAHSAAKDVFCCTWSYDQNIYITMNSGAHSAAKDVSCCTWSYDQYIYPAMNDSAHWMAKYFFFMNSYVQNQQSM